MKEHHHVWGRVRHWGTKQVGRELGHPPHFKDYPKTAEGASEYMVRGKRVRGKVMPRNEK